MNMADPSQTTPIPFAWKRLSETSQDEVDLVIQRELCGSLGEELALVVMAYIHSEYMKERSRTASTDLASRQMISCSPYMTTFVSSSKMGSQSVIAHSCSSGLSSL